MTSAFGRKADMPKHASTLTHTSINRRLSILADVTLQHRRRLVRP